MLGNVHKIVYAGECMCVRESLYALGNSLSERVCESACWSNVHETMLGNILCMSVLGNVRAYFGGGCVRVMGKCAVSATEHHFHTNYI